MDDDIYDHHVVVSFTTSLLAGERDEEETITDGDGDEFPSHSLHFLIIPSLRRFLACSTRPSQISADVDPAGLRLA